MPGDDYLEPKVGTTLPLVALREQLAEARTRGESFGSVWPVKGVLGQVDPSCRREWRECLEQTRSTWERAYDQLPPTRGEQALERAHILIDREPLADRACASCGRPIPDAAKRNAEFCSRECRRGTEVRDRHLGPAGERQRPDVPVVLEADWSQLELVA